MIVGQPDPVKKKKEEKIKKVVKYYISHYII